MQLPNYEEPILLIRQLEEALVEANPQVLIQDKLHIFIDEMQLGLINIFNKVDETYF